MDIKKTAGAILSAAGLSGVIYYGYKYMEASDSFEVFGADVTVSSGDYVPIIISALVLVIGILLYKK